MADHPNEVAVAPPPDHDAPALLLERAAEHPANPFLEVFETGRQLHVSLDAGARWLILDFGSGPPPMADVAMAFALVRAGRRASRAGGALVVVVPDDQTERSLRAAEPAAAKLDIVQTRNAAEARLAHLRGASAERAR